MINRMIDSACISFWGSNLVAFYLSFISPLLGYYPMSAWIDNILKTAILVFIIHMFIYPLALCTKQKKKKNKVVLLVMSILAPVAFGYFVYFFRLFRGFQLDEK